jgi:hypothetical protein
MRSHSHDRQPFHIRMLARQGDFVASQGSFSARPSPLSDLSTGAGLSAPRLSIIPAGAVTDRSLEPRDLQTLCLLGRHTDRAGWCARSQVKMARELGCGRSSVQRSLERLCEAGWVEKKRRDEAGKADESSQPSASYAYRVVLDRDDFAFENATRDIDSDDDASHAETASDEGVCPPVGTPVDGETSSQIAAENASGGAQPDGHPGAHAERAPGAHTYVGTKNAPLERPHLERDDADARVRPLVEKSASDLAEQLLVIAGHDPKFWPPGWCGAPMRVQSWLNSGWPPQIIIAATTAVAARKTGPPAATVQFFENAIAEEIARQNRPVPEISNVPTTGENRQPARKGNAYARIAARLGQSSGDPVDGS